LVGSVSVIGLLQSNERIGTSGIVVEPAPPPPPPPPEPTVDVGVYSDSNCTIALTSIVWGSIEKGGSVNKIAYIKNSGNQGVTLSLAAENWVPDGAATDMTLSWDYVNGTVIAPGAVVEVTFTLTVDAGINGIDSFSFDIVITASQS